MEPTMAEREHAEQALLASEQLYRVVVENVTDAISITVGEKRVFANQAFLKLLGLRDSSEALGALVEQSLVPEDRVRYRERRAASRRGDPVDALAELRILRPDGEVRTVETSGRDIEYQGQQARLVVLRDITERKLAEQELRERTRELEALFNVATIFADPGDFVERVTRALEEVERAAEVDSAHLRVPDDKEEGLRLVAAVGKGVDDRPPVAFSPFADTRSGRVFKSGELVIDNDNSQRRGRALAAYGSQSAAWLPVKASGRTTGVLTVNSTELGYFTPPRIQMLTAIASGIGGFVENANLREAERLHVEELDRQAGELTRSNAELELFASVASHDLQEPLRMVASYTQLLGRRYKGKLDADADDFIHYAVDGAIRMQTLINDLLAYSRVSSHGEAPILTECETILHDALGNLQQAIEETGAVVTHDPMPTVAADAPQLRQLFQNLIGNAVKYRGDRPPTIHVGVTRKGDDWLFSVEDNGIGIEPKHTERVFEIFQRLHTREEYSGTGIGLAICKKIVERHGGRISVTSKPGKGSTFRFTLPAGPGDDS